MYMLQLKKILSLKMLSSEPLASHSGNIKTVDKKQKITDHKLP